MYNFFLPSLIIQKTCKIYKFENSNKFYIPKFKSRNPKFLGQQIRGNFFIYSGSSRICSSKNLLEYLGKNLEFCFQLKYSVLSCFFFQVYYYDSIVSGNLVSSTNPPYFDRSNLTSRTSIILP